MLYIVLGTITYSTLVLGTVTYSTLFWGQFWEQFYAVLCLKDSFGNSSLQYVVLRAVLGTVIYSV